MKKKTKTVPSVIILVLLTGSHSLSLPVSLMLEGSGGLTRLWFRSDGLIPQHGKKTQALNRSDG